MSSYDVFVIREHDSYAWSDPINVHIIGLTNLFVKLNFLNSDTMYSRTTHGKNHTFDFRLANYWGKSIISQKGAIFEYVTN